ncbi:MAG: DUF3307 domain-containing protein [Bacteroidota bacterium]
MIFSLLLLAHWIGDFCLQTSNMALYKSKSLKWLLFHVLTYTGVLLAFSTFLISLEDLAVFVGINGLLHGVTDFFTSKLAHRYKDIPRRFFPILGFDQLLHTLTLYWTLQMI